MLSAASLFLPALIPALERVHHDPSVSAPLPPGSLRVSSEVSASHLNGTIVIAGPSSLQPGDPYYESCVKFTRAHDAFSRWLVTVRGGIRLRGGRYGLKFVYVGDGSSEAQVGDATAHAARMPTVDFVVSGYSSGLTYLAAQQSFAAGKLLIGAGAAATSVFTQNNLSFGLVVPARRFLTNGIPAIADAARRADEAGTPSRCAPSGAGCFDSLRFGFLEFNHLFSRAVCDDASFKQAMSASGLPVPETLLKASLSSHAEVEDKLRRFRTAGVNVLVGCTYFDDVKAIVAALEALDYAPLAMVAFDDVQSVAEVSSGWWQGDGLLVAYNWGWTKLDKRGEFTGMTAQEFLRMAHVEGEEEDTPDLGNFMASVALVDAIERAQSLDSLAVAKALETTHLDEFWPGPEPITFDENHQLNLSADISQGQTHTKNNAAYKTHIVYPSSAATSSVRFPTPTWAQRRCQVLGAARRAYNASESRLQSWWLRIECSGHGACDLEGLCECEEGWEGVECEEARGVQSFVMVTLVPIGSVLGLLLLMLCAFGCRKGYERWQRAIKAHKAAEARRIQHIRDAVTMMQTLNFPLCVMRFSQFKALGKLMAHEEARDQGLLRILDRWEDAMTFAKTHPICFNSHQWLGFTAPDPNNVHYPGMVQAGQALCRMHDVAEDNLWVWVDFFSIPQRCKASQLSAISSIAVYACCAKYFLVCAIECTHNDTKKPCNPETYSQRGWCRLEQWSFMGVHGVAHMYLMERTTDENLVLLKEKRAWLEESIRVMDGDFSVESDKQRLVDVILGLYAFMKAGGSDEKEEHTVGKGGERSVRKGGLLLQALLDEHHAEVFPGEYFDGLELLLERELEVARSSDDASTSAFSAEDFDAVLLAREAFSQVQGHSLPQFLMRRLSTRSPGRVERAGTGRLALFKASSSKGAIWRSRGSEAMKAVQFSVHDHESETSEQAVLAEKEGEASTRT